MIGIESSSPSTTGDKLRQTRLGDVDGFVAIGELDGIWRASAIREQCPRLGEILDTTSIRTSKPKSDYCRLTWNAPSWAVARSTLSWDKSPATKTSRYTLRWLCSEMRGIRGRGSFVARTREKVSISMIRPNRKGNMGATSARRMKNAINRDHGRLLEEC